MSCLSDDKKQATLNGKRKCNRPAHRRLRDDWGLQGCGFGRWRRLDWLALLAAIRFACVLCHAPWDSGER